jgi:hypothetical protein
MIKRLCLVLIAGLVVLLCPYVNAEKIVDHNSDSDLSVVQYLIDLTDDQRRNAEISFILPLGIDPSLEKLKTHVEELWNNSDFDKAITEAITLEKHCDSEKFLINISWRVPVVCSEPGRSSKGGRIDSDQENANFVDMAVDPVTGNIFCVILYYDNPNYLNSLYFSSDQGDSWLGLGSTLSSTGMLTDASVTISGGYCYRACNWGQREVLLYRNLTSTGTEVNFPSGASYVIPITLTSPQKIDQFELVTQPNYSDQQNPFLFVSTDDSPSIIILQSLDYGENWLEIENISFGDPIKGLDVCANYNFTIYPFYISYIDSYDTFILLGLNGYTYSLIILDYFYVNSSIPDQTSVGAYDNNVFVAYEYYSSDHVSCLFNTSSDGGDNFNGPAYLNGDGTDITFSPDVTLAGGSGKGMIYMRDEFVHNSGKFIWKTYDDNTQGDIGTFANGTASNKMPDIEPLGGGEYGIVYIHYDYPIGGVYFQKASQCCDGMRGDANIDGAILVDDLVLLVDFLFKGGPDPVCVLEGDANGSGQILVDDLVLLVDFLFKGGSSPTACP